MLGRLTVAIGVFLAFALASIFVHERVHVEQARRLGIKAHDHYGSPCPTGACILALEDDWAKWNPHNGRNESVAYAAQAPFLVVGAVLAAWVLVRGRA